MKIKAAALTIVFLAFSCQQSNSELKNKRGEQDDTVASEEQKKEEKTSTADNIIIPDSATVENSTFGLTAFQKVGERLIELSKGAEFRIAEEYRNKVQEIAEKRFKIVDDFVNEVEIEVIIEETERLIRKIKLIRLESLAVEPELTELVLNKEQPISVFGVYSNDIRSDISDSDDLSLESSPADSLTIERNDQGIIIKGMKEGEVALQINYLNQTKVLTLNVKPQAANNPMPGNQPAPQPNNGCQSKVKDGGYCWQLTQNSCNSVCGVGKVDMSAFPFIPIQLEPSALCTSLFNQFKASIPQTTFLFNQQETKLACMWVNYPGTAGPVELNLFAYSPFDPAASTPGVYHPCPCKK